MNDDINNMIALYIESMKIVIQSETDKGNRTGGRAFESCFSDFSECKIGYPDVGVVINPVVIESKGNLQAVGIDTKTQRNKDQQNQYGAYSGWFHWI